MASAFKPSAQTKLLSASLLSAFGISPEDHPDCLKAAQLAYHAVSRGATCVESGDKPDQITPSIIKAIPAKMLIEAYFKTPSAELFKSDRPLTVTEGKLYLSKFCEQEARLAETIIRIRDRKADNLWTPGEECIKHPDPTKVLHIRQKEAVHKFANSNLLVLTGGPGTGKTTTASAMISTAVQEGGYKLDEIQLCAPTGRAMSQLYKGIYESELLKKVDLAGLKPAQTIQKIIHNPELISGIRLIFVDECSMVDLSTFNSLLKLIEKARIVLIGDPKQLPSIDTGSVFTDLCNSTSIQANIAVLEKGQRNKEQPLAWSHFTLNPDGPKPDKDKYGEILPNTADRIVKASHDAFSAIIKKAKEGEAAEAVKMLNSVKILCSRREGQTGVRKLNQLIRKKHDLTEPLVPGSIIMVNKNDHRVTGLSNGDVGIIMANGEACFAENRTGQAGSKIRFVKPSQIPSYEDAFATTVHKSQGSEYDVVHISISGKPDVSDDSMEHDGFLNRELLFTAVTRAKNTVNIYSDETVFIDALRQQARRSSGLEERLNAIG
jgi:exodeoxyribonuclease V alpha subunit